ncbi:MAG: PKD domain-containing protein, partial [Bacteroidota bacterium]
MFIRPSLWYVVLFGLTPFLSFSQITADFNANRTNGCGSLQVSFTDQSSTTTGTIVSWSWDLGGVNASNQNPGRIFGTPGNYTICLTVTDSEGNSDTECKNNFITVYELPQPDFSVSTTDGCIPSQITFTDLSTASSGTIQEWIWGIGGEKGVIVDDGSQPTFDNTYSLADAYTISLTVTDDNNCSNTITREDYITIHPDPIVNFSADQTFGCNTPFVVNFTNDSPDLNLEYQWIFSNGIEFNGTTPPPVAFTEVGWYDATLIAVDNQTGCTDTLVMPNYIQVSYPIDFEFTPGSGCEDLGVDFQDLSPDPASEVTWNFGDNNTSTDPNPTHIYTDPGCYTVILSRLVNGCLTVRASEVCIEVFPEPSGSMINDNPLGCSLPHLVNFTSNTSNTTNWNWDFGDGNTSTDPNPTYAYNSVGVFPVRLTITSDRGCTQTILTDTIRIVELNARMIENEEQGCTPLTFSLQENAQSVTAIVDWEWWVRSNASSPPIEFNSTDQFPTFTLVDTGFYDVTLIVTNSIGCVDTTLYEKAVAVGMPPQVDFVAAPTVSCINTAVFFTDQSSTYANAWFWEFGDGGTSEEENPFHEYADTGRFDVTLTTLHHGCPNEMVFEQYIEVTPPKAGFEIERSCDDRFTIELVDISIGSDSMFYDFGVENDDMDTTSVRSPSFTYPRTGIYTLTQYVYNFTTGCADTLFEEVIITDPEALFTIEETKGCVPFELNITDNSRFGSSYQWSAPGAVISDPSAEVPVIEYRAAGTHSNIKLVIRDVNGCLDSLIFTDTIWANATSANFTVAPQTGCRPLFTEYIESSSSMFGNLVEWRWNFNDGTDWVFEQNPTHTFDTAGYFDVRLVVVDDWGCANGLTLDSIVEVTHPIADFVTADTLGCRSLAIAFENRSSGKNLSYFWTFGDGSTSTAFSPTHNYALEGTYTVCLEVSDEYGCDSLLCREDYVVIADPVAAFTQDQTFGTCPPLLVSYQNLSQNATTYEWDFGDESGSSNLESPPHLYTIPGVYDVSLIAIATEDCRDTLVIDDLIHLDGPVGNFHFDIDTSCAPATITFFGASIEPYDYIWDFGNGDLDTTVNVLTDTISYVYQNSGAYVPKLVLIDATECHRTLQSEDTITVASMSIDFIADRTILCDNNAAVTFSNLTASSHPIQLVEWTFAGADPASATNFEPQVLFNNPGTYDVQLFMSNGICRDSFTREEYIRTGAVPEVNFALSDTFGCAPFTVEFTDLSTVQNATIGEWAWNFGNGNATDLENPVHVFSDAGTYEVQLTVTSTIGCQDSTTLSLSAFEVPTFDLREVPTICIGEFVQLGADIQSDTTGATYQWLPSPDLTCTTCLDPLVNPA